MGRKLKSPIFQSLLIHALLISGLIVLMNTDRPNEKVDSVITLENVRVSDQIKKVFHRAIHSMGIPHREPEESERQLPESDPADSLGENSADEGAGGGIPASEMQKYFIEVVNRLHRTKQYPKEAQFNEQEGVVRVLLEIAPDGRILRSEVEKNSTFKSLNDAAIAAVQKLGQLPPLPLKPSGAPTSKPIILHIPIHFKLH